MLIRLQVSPSLTRVGVYVITLYEGSNIDLLINVVITYTLIETYQKGKSKMFDIDRLFLIVILLIQS